MMNLKKLCLFSSFSGEYYRIFNSYDKSIFVINDRDKEVYYPKAIFNTISEYRQKQIESLVINNKQI